MMKRTFPYSKSLQQKDEADETSSGSYKYDDVVTPVISASWADFPGVSDGPGRENSFVE